jgi:hypothetical protein
MLFWNGLPGREKPLDPQIDQLPSRLSGVDLSAASVANNLPVDLIGVLLTDGLEASVALRVDPGPPDREGWASAPAATSYCSHPHCT